VGEAAGGLVQVAVATRQLVWGVNKAGNLYSTIV
jgi:hypothetical protein